MQGIRANLATQAKWGHLVPRELPEFLALQVRLDPLLICLLTTSNWRFRNRVTIKVLVQSNRFNICKLKSVRLDLGDLQDPWDY